MALRADEICMPHGYISRKDIDLLKACNKPAVGQIWAAHRLATGLLLARYWPTTSLILAVHRPYIGLCRPNTVVKRPHICLM